jgi:hypothetical protein
MYTMKLPLPVYVYSVVVVEKAKAKHAIPAQDPSGFKFKTKLLQVFIFIRNSSFETKKRPDLKGTVNGESKITVNV